MRGRDAVRALFVLLVGATMIYASEQQKQAPRDCCDDRGFLIKAAEIAVQAKDWSVMEKALAHIGADCGRDSGVFRCR